MSKRQEWREPEDEVSHSPRFWPKSIWLAALLVEAGAVILASVSYVLQRTRSSVQVSAPIEVVKITLTLMAAFAAVLAGAYAYRKQKLSEGDATRADADQKRADADQRDRRYIAAAEQLGHDKSAVRLAGAYAMSRLADDWPQQQQQCIDVLCAYLRMRSDVDAGDDGEVRATIVRTIADHLRDQSRVSWARHDFDFTGATLHNAGFRSVTFPKCTSFQGALFTGETTSFDQARFSEDASFEGATFSGANTSFELATFSGEDTNFGGATFSGANTNFEKATFSAGEASFEGATFSCAATWFDRATFSGRYANFSDATFSGDTSFISTEFSDSDFRRAKFSGNVRFKGARFSGGCTYFDNTTFSGGDTVFRGATFSGDYVDFTRARFSGEWTTFFDATFSTRYTTFKEAMFTGGVTPFVAMAGSSFVGREVVWGPIPPRLLPSSKVADENHTRLRQASLESP